MWQTDYDIDGIPWDFSVPINSTNNPCNSHWQYLQCNNNCQIIEILLINVNLNGSLPNSLFDGLMYVMNVSIANNPLLTGSIPSSLYTSLSLNQTLIHLDLSKNSLSGSLPQGFSINLSSLEYLDVSHNHYLAGAIPVSLGTHLHHIAYVDLSFNKFDEVDWDIADVSFTSSLIYWDMSNNLLVGAVPALIYTRSTMLTFFDCSDNLFSQSLSQFSISIPFSLLYFSVQHNLLTGYLPDNFPSSLVALDVGNNMFIGTLSTSYSMLTNLILFNVSHNNLDGNLPTTLLTTWRNISVLDISFNNFDGTLSQSIVSPSLMPSLTYFSNQFNYFTSQLPDIIETNEFSPSSRLIVLCLGFNMFTGTIPPSWSLLTELELLNLNSNQLNGPIPLSLGNNMQYLIALNVSDNSLQGSFPSSFSSLTKLQFLDLSYNSLTGSIPTDVLDTMTSLTAILLQHNHFIGRFLINTSSSSTSSFASRHPILSSIDISNNAFTGEISTEIFTLPSLTTLSMLSNCFHDTSIPYNICNSSKLLNILVLDGLHSSPYCTTTYFSTTNTYPLLSSLKGTIPSCLFTDFPVLKTLHMSGNGIRGKLPDIGMITPSLTDVTLSHNQLTGSISHIYQNHRWKHLDLSFNKFTGKLSNSLFQYTTDNASSVSLSLRMNRLSGDIPHTLRNLPTIKILQGNIFTCNDDKSTLPLHDPIYFSYDCGTNNFNTSVYIWIGCYSLIIIIVIIFILRKQLLNVFNDNNVIKRLDQMEIMILSYWDVYRSNSVSLFLDLSIEHLVEWGIVFKQLRLWIIKLTILIIIIFIPLYLILNTFYSTYDETYALTISLSFLSGIPPAIILTICLVSGLILLYSKYCQYLRINLYHVFQYIAMKTNKLHKITHASLAKRPISTRISLAKENLILYSKIISVLLLNLIIVMPATIGFIYSNDAHISITEQQTVVIAFTIFKLIWNYIIYELMRLVFCRIPTTTTTTTNRGTTTGNQITTTTTTVIGSFVSLSDELYSFFALFMTWISLFNNIIAPCIAAMIFSPSCFYYTIGKEPSISVNYSTKSCSIDFIESTISGLYYPHVNCIGESNDVGYSIGGGGDVVYSVSYNPPFFYSYHCSSEILKDFDEVFVLRFLINGLILPIAKIIAKILQEYLHSLSRNDPMNAQSNTDGNVSPQQQNNTVANTSIHNGDGNLVIVREHWLIPYLNMLIPPILQVYSQPLTLPSEIEHFEKSIPKQIFRAENFLIDIVTDIALVLTFGVMFPPLAIIGCISVLSLSCFKQLVIGRVVSLARTQPYLIEYVEKLNTECVGARAIVTRALSSFMELLALFWAGYLFDILGDSIGYRKAIALLILMSFVPLLIRGSNWIYKKCYSNNNKENNQKKDDDELIRVSKVLRTQNIELANGRWNESQDMKDETNNPMH